MNLKVHTVGRELFVESDALPTCVKRHVPKHHKKFRSELYYFQRAIREWLGEATVESITFYRPPGMNYWHRSLYSAVVTATRRPDRLVQLYNVEEGKEDQPNDRGD